MKLFSLLFFISIFSFAQVIDTINLKEVALVDYSKYKQFRPKYKKLHHNSVYIKNDLIIVSNFQLPKQDEVEIVAIEFLFESKRGKKNVCSDVYYIAPKIIRETNPSLNLVEDKLFSVEKDYKGKFIFPVNIKIKSNEVNNYLLGFELSSEVSSCTKNYSYYDLLITKEKSYYFNYTNNYKTSNKQELFNHYSLNYKIYYK